MRDEVRKEIQEALDQATTDRKEAEAELHRQVPEIKKEIKEAHEWDKSEQRKAAVRRASQNVQSARTLLLGAEGALAPFKDDPDIKERVRALRHHAEQLRTLAERIANNATRARELGEEDYESQDQQD